MKKQIALVLLLSLALLVAGCTQPKTTSLPSTVDQHLAWIPQNVNGVAYVDVQSLRQSELGVKLEEDFDKPWSRMRDDEHLKELLEMANFDFEKDLHSVLAGFRGSAHDSLNSFALVVTGNFDEQKISETLRAVQDSMAQHHHDAPKMSTETYYGKTLYVIKEHGERAFYFADAHTLVASNKDWVQAIIDGKTADQSVKQNNAISALMNKLRFKEQGWVVANTAEVMEKVAEEMGRSSNFKGTRAVKAVQGVTFSAKFAKNAELDGEAVCDSEESSKLLVEALKGALATAKLAVSDDREAVDMLNHIDIGMSGKAVKFNADLDKAFFDKMREKAEKQGKAIAMF